MSEVTLSQSLKSQNLRRRPLGSLRLGRGLPEQGPRGASGQRGRRDEGLHPEGRAPEEGTRRRDEADRNPGGGRPIRSQPQHEEVCM